MGKSRLLFWIILATALTNICVPICSKADDTKLGTGYELKSYCNDNNYQVNNGLWAACIGFVSGTDQGLLYGALNVLIPIYPNGSQQQLTKDANIANHYCTPPHTTRLQMALIVSKYLHSHPENLNNAIALEIIRAFMSAWPCPNTSN